MDIIVTETYQYAAKFRETHKDRIKTQSCVLNGIILTVMSFMCFFTQMLIGNTVNAKKKVLYQQTLSFDSKGF
jgi:uncharacterized membrane protein